MKKILQLATLFLLAILAGSVMAQTTGSPLDLGLPNLHDPGWNTIINNNSIAINAYAATNNTGTAINTLMQRLPNCNIAGGYFYSPFLGQCAIPSGGGGGGAVASVFGRTGIVVQQVGDYSFSLISGVADSSQLPTGSSSTPGALRCGSNTICTGGVISVANGNVGTVTSVSAGNLSPLFSASVSTATTTPAITFTPGAAAQGSVLAGPASGGPGNYSFRLLQSTDIGLASTTVFGVAKCDGTTTTCSGGVISAVSSGGSGTITPSLKFQLPFYSATGTANTLTGDSAITTDGSGNLTSVTSSTTGSGGVGGGMSNLEGTPPSGAATKYVWWADSASHRPKFNPNNAGVEYFAGVVTVGTAGHAWGVASNGIDLVDIGASTNTIVASPKFQLPFYSGTGTAQTLTGDSAITTDGSGHETVASMGATGTAGVGGGWLLSCGTATVATAGNVSLWADSINCRFKLNNAGVGAVDVPTIATAGTAGHVWAVATGGLDMVDGGALGTAAVVNLGTNVATFLTTPTSANFFAAITDETGTGVAVAATSPTLVTPTIGAATATSVNKVAITAPATSATLTIANGKTLTANNSITIAGTDATTMTFPSASATITQTIASGQTVIPVTALAGNTCDSSATTATATGGATTDSVAVTYASDPTGVTGYGGGTAGGITISAWITSNTFNFKRCNQTSSSVTPGALSVNWRITR